MLYIASQTPTNNCSANHDCFQTFVCTREDSVVTPRLPARISPDSRLCVEQPLNSFKKCGMWIPNAMQPKKKRVMSGIGA